MDVVASQLWQLEENLSSFLWACISAVEKLFQEVQQLKENDFLPFHTGQYLSY